MIKLTSGIVFLTSPGGNWSSEQQLFLKKKKRAPKIFLLLIPFSQRFEYKQHFSCRFMTEMSTLGSTVVLQQEGPVFCMEFA